MNLKNNKQDYKTAAKILKSGGVGIIPTDTIYGLVGRALNKKSVAKIYKLRKRNPKKPFIILISSLNDLAVFGTKPDKSTSKILNKVWPGKISVILPCEKRKFRFLHCGANSLAFRLPAAKSLVNLIKSVGPLVAPSANVEGKKPAATIAEAKKYFGGKVDFYFDAGKKKSPPSALIKILNKKIIVLRQGAKKIQ